VGLGWLGDRTAFALADGSVLIVGAESEERVEAHDGSILQIASDGTRLVTGGDDGRVVATAPDGRTSEIAQGNGSWIDALALHPKGAVAFASGKQVTVLDEKGRPKTWTSPSTPRGLAFAPKGLRLAIAHYNGATLWYPNLETKPDTLEWKGSHLDITWSPDGRFVVTSMQENALHGWRLQPDRGHMRMSGYAAKPRSVSWSFGGAWLATSGAEAAIVWPFDSKEGPTGKPPRECGVRPSRVARVAFHPNVNVLAIGYEDGCILLVRFEDVAELLVRPATATRSGRSAGTRGADVWRSARRAARPACSSSRVDRDAGPASRITPARAARHRRRRPHQTDDARACRAKRRVGRDRERDRVPRPKLPRARNRDPDHGARTSHACDQSRQAEERRHRGGSAPGGRERGSAVMIGRLLALLLGVGLAIAFSQLPEFAQQYRQRLGGAIDELRGVVSRFDQTAQGSGLTRGEALDRLGRDVDPLVKRQGEATGQVVERLERLERQRRAFAEAGSFERVLVLVRDIDPVMARAVYLDFEPAVPATREGAVAAGAGFCSAGAEPCLGAVSAAD
jgi:sugar lactone lactonase YvrE